MVNFTQAKGQLSSMEHAVKSLQVDLEKTQFALEVKKGACQLAQKQSLVSRLHSS